MSSDDNSRCEWGYLLDDDSKEFGLTLDEYHILLDDITQAVEEGNRKYGYGGTRYLAEDGNYYLSEPQEQEQTPKYVDHTTIHYLRKANPSVEEVAIARGLVKVRKEDS